MEERDCGGRYSAEKGRRKERLKLVTLALPARLPALWVSFSLETMGSVDGQGAQAAVACEEKLAPCRA